MLCVRRCALPLLALPVWAASAGGQEDAYPARPYRAVSELPPELRTIRDRWLDLQTLRAADGDLPAVRAAVESRTAGAHKLMESQIRDPADPNLGSWGKVSGVADRAISFDGGYYRQPQALAEVHACPHSPLAGDPELLKSLNAALTFGARFYHVGAERPGNWWAWDIGSTSRLNSTLLCAGDAMDPDLREAYMQAMYWQGNHPVGLGFQKPGTGANAIWIAANAMRLALLSGDEPLMQRAADIYAVVARLGPEKGDGIMPDGSFHQHGNGINMGYGAAMLGDVTQYMHLTAGTSYELPAESVAAMARFFADYVVWDSYKGKYNPYSSGRAATRPGACRSSAAATAAIYLLHAELPAAREAALATLHDYSGAEAERALDLVPALSAFTGTVLPAIREAPLVAGVRALPYSDMIVARSAAHFLSVRLACDTKGWFSIHNENLKAQQVGEGSVVLMTDGRELEADTQYNQPWDRLPGVSHCASLARGREAPGESTMVACASTANAGVLAADYLLTGEAGRLTARKGYFLLGEHLVLLANRLRATVDEPIHTTLWAVPVRDAAEALLGGQVTPLSEVTGALNPGQGLLYRGSGVIPLVNGVAVSHETLSVVDTDVNQLNGRGEAFTNDYLFATCVVPAGETGGYEVLVLAGVGEPGFRRAMADCPVRVAANEARLQGVLLADGSAGAVAAFEAGTCDAGGLSAPGGIVWERQGNRVEVVVSRRNVEAEALQVTLPLELGLVSVGTLTNSEPGRTTIELDLPGGYIIEQRLTARIAE